GQAEDLLNVTSTMSRRIDLVQFRGPFTVTDAQVVGASPADRLPLGLWPSDHAGVVATLSLPPSGGDDDYGYLTAIGATPDPVTPRSLSGSTTNAYSCAVSRARASRSRFSIR